MKDKKREEDYDVFKATSTHSKVTERTCSYQPVRKHIAIGRAEGSESRGFMLLIRRERKVEKRK